MKLAVAPLSEDGSLKKPRSNCSLTGATQLRLPGEGKGAGFSNKRPEIVEIGSEKKQDDDDDSDNRDDRDDSDDSDDSDGGGGGGG
eukprot:CAMPEP_0177671756 /NCGR_PEP_ID=MMETSP0447-20121125/24916_1 /TAXON_ID=0 /ORGANISM="Stygamoeba regulata, Strain BSH-02190019" /LENGTH=85 /DNA_ID=CAMNT_0019179255 /DNA_START=238 /DNA_END=491 /DNA_ORIENTATION=+